MLKKGQLCTRVIPSSLQAMLTGAVRCEIAHPDYCLTYSDGTQDNVRLDDMPDTEDWLALVSAIQAAREALKGET